MWHNISSMFIGLPLVFSGICQHFPNSFSHARRTAFTWSKVIANIALEAVENQVPLSICLGWRPTLEKKELGVFGLQLFFGTLENKRWFVAQTQPCEIYYEGSRATLRGGLVLSLQVFILSRAISVLWDQVSSSPLRGPVEGYVHFCGIQCALATWLWLIWSSLVCSCRPR